MLPPWRKRRFCRFLHFRRGGNVIFRIFRSSEASDETKTAKFGIDHTTENGKSRPAACGKQSPYALGRCGAWGRI